MSVNKGGRGKKAPYQTKVIRIPLPLEERINQLIQEFHNSEKSNTSEEEINL